MTPGLRLGVQIVCGLGLRRVFLCRVSFALGPRRLPVVGGWAAGSAVLGRPEFAEGMEWDQRDEMRRGCAGRRDCVRLGHEGDDMLRNLRFGVGMRCSVGRMRHLHICSEHGRWYL